MTTDQLSEQAEAHDVMDILKHPDPDPADLPAIIPPSVLTEEAIAARILRSSITLDTMIDQHKERMQRDSEAWGHSIAVLEQKRQAWRAMIRDWMLRNDVKQIKTPWFTASVTKARTRIVVDSEDEALAVLRGLKGGEKAIRVKETIIKAELEAIYNAVPSAFGKAVRTEEGEPGLTVRKKEATT